MSRLHSSFCALLGIETPIALAAMGGCVTPELAGAVSIAGGLGMMGVTGQGYEGTAAKIRATKALTRRPFGIGVICAYDVDAEVDAICDHPPAAAAFFWGDFAAQAKRVHAAGVKVIAQIGSVDEARRAVDAGADIIVAQGYDAGGHVRGTVGTFSLVPQVVDACPDVPVLAAGGIADGRGLAASICLGAAGAWIGTRFLAAAETDIHADYRDAVIASNAEDTDISTLYDIGWPDAPGRVLKTGLVRDWIAAGRPPPGDRKGEGEVVVNHPNGDEYLRYEPFVVSSAAQGAICEAPHWAGQAVGLVNKTQLASEIVTEITAEAEQILEGSI